MSRKVSLFTCSSFKFGWLGVHNAKALKMMKQVFLSAMQAQERHQSCNGLRWKFFVRLCQLSNRKSRKRHSASTGHKHSLGKTHRKHWRLSGFPISLCLRTGSSYLRMVTPLVTGTFPGDFAHLGMCLIKTNVFLRCLWLCGKSIS